MAEIIESDWTKLTVAQLKGALARRGLDTTGVKDELVKRLQDHDKETGVAKASEDNVMEVTEQEKEPELMFPSIRKAYNIIFSMRTVIITPVTTEVLQNACFLSWLDECASYTIKKNSAGKSAMKLEFNTIEKGEAALTDMKTNIVAEGVEITHPVPWVAMDFASSFGSHRIQLMFQKKFEERDMTTDSFNSRLIVLKNLPANLNTEEILNEFFPEALHAISYQFDPATKGFASLEFKTEAEADEYLKSTGKKVTIENCEISLERFSELELSYRKNRRKNAREQKRGQQTEKVVLGDEERVAVNRDCKESQSELDNLHNSDEVLGREKVTKFYELSAKLQDLRHRLTKDTIRRLQEGETTMPEPEEEMLSSTKNKIDQKKNKGNKKKAPIPNLKKLDELDDQLQVAYRNFLSLQNNIKQQEGQLSQEQKSERATKVQPLFFMGRSGNEVKKQQVAKNEILLKSAIIKTQNRQQQQSAAKVTGDMNQNQKKKKGNRQSFERDQPPQKIRKQDNYQGWQGRNTDWQQPQWNRNQGNSGRGQTGRGRGRGRRDQYMQGNQTMYPNLVQHDGGMKIVQGLTTALTEKMKQLEEMQQQTLNTQAQLLVSNTGYSNYTGRNYTSNPAASSTAAPNTSGTDAAYGGSSKFGGSDSTYDSGNKFGSYGDSTASSYGFSGSNNSSAFKFGAGYGADTKTYDYGHKQF